MKIADTNFKYFKKIEYTVSEKRTSLWTKLGWRKRGSKTIAEHE